ncbi:MAG TPA: PadR family transcriptional regulator [Saprospiraceae bacterium]|nr:PadR family transcriptional regulator [Saprospiraceae bacterium]
MNSNLLRGSIESIVIKLVAEHREVYGYQICQLVKSMTDSKILLTEGALYPILHKLEINGTLEVELRNVEGRTRKYYKLTQNGHSILDQKLGEMKEYLEQMSLIFQPTIKNLT